MSAAACGSCTTTSTTTFPPTRTTAARAPRRADEANAVVEQEDPARDDGTPQALRVRVNLFKRVYDALSVLGRLRKSTLMISAFLTFGQVIAFSVILGLSARQQCDQPLRTFLIMTIVKVAVSFPLTFYHALTPIRPTRRDDDDRRRHIEQTRRIGSQATDARVRKVSDLTGLFGFVVFILGNWFFFSSQTCQATSPMLFWSTLTALIFSWLYFLEIFLIVIAVLFFLPLLLVGMRWAGVGQEKNEVGPLSKNEIEKLPLRVYAGVLQSPELTAPETAPAPPSPSKTETETDATKAGKRNFSRLWSNVRRPVASRRRASSKASKSEATSDGNSGAFSHLPRLPAGMTYVELPESQSSCAICLCDYEAPPSTSEAQGWEPEPLRVLSCEHAFHSACLDSWLGISGRCALCQRPVVKRADSNSESAAPIGAAAPAWQPAPARDTTAAAAV